MSQHDREERLRQLLETTLEQPPDDRLEFLAASGAEKSLRLEVLELLGDLEDLSGFLEFPAISLIDSESHDPALGPEEDSWASGRQTTHQRLEPGSWASGRQDEASLHVGPFRILQTLGRGGMGHVYLAEQADPLPRRVALKTLQAPGPFEQLWQRFELEQKVMARMDHPNIAVIFGAGKAPGGTAYLATELLLDGDILTYSNRQRLDLAARLDLFEQVCRAVRHAHDNGVIHRDLKPSNILIKEIDGQPIPKLIDFGITKWLDSRDTGLTEEGQLIGSPTAMPPELLHDPSSRTADVRIDIFALGVLLYRLLVDENPFEDSPDLAARLQEPTPRTLRSPSQCLREIDIETLIRIAEHRSTSPNDLIQRLQGDLDAITRKAMATERAERYESADELLADLHAFRQGRPVRANPEDKGRSAADEHDGPTASPRVEIIDLSQEVYAGMPVYKGLPEVEMAVHVTHEEWDGDTESDEATPGVLRLTLGEHTGTHVDALSHMAKPHKAQSIETMPLSMFYTPGLCLDLSDKGLRALIEPDDLERALDATGHAIEPGDTVLLYTDHYRRTVGTDDWPRGPGLSVDATRWLGERKVAAFGVETMSPGIPGISNREVHHLCGAMGFTHYENLVELHRLVGRGRFRFIGLPLRLRGGTGSPVRAVAVFEGT